MDTPTNHPDKHIETTKTPNNSPTTPAENSDNDKKKDNNNRYLTTAVGNHQPNESTTQQQFPPNETLANSEDDEILDSLTIREHHWNVSVPELNDFNELELIERNVRENEEMSAKINNSLAMEDESCNSVEIED